MHFQNLVWTCFFLKLPWARPFSWPSRRRRHLNLTAPTTWNHHPRFAATSIILSLMFLCPPAPSKKWSLKMVMAKARTFSVHLPLLTPARKGPPRICGTRNRLYDTMRDGCLIGLLKMCPSVWTCTISNGCDIAYEIVKGAWTKYVKTHLLIGAFPKWSKMGLLPCIIQSWPCPLGMTWGSKLTGHPYRPRRSQEVNMFFSQRGSCWRSTFSDFLASWMMLNNLNHEKHWVCIYIYIYTYT